MKLWKFLTLNSAGRIVSINSRDTIWTPDAVKVYPYPLEICKSGYHASSTIEQAARSCAGDIIGWMNCGSTFIKGSDKYVLREMTLVRAWDLQKRDLSHLVNHIAEHFNVQEPLIADYLVGKQPERRPVIISSDITNERFVYLLAQKIQFKNCFDILSDIAVCDRLSGVLNTFFLNHIIPRPPLIQTLRVGKI